MMNRAVTAVILGIALLGCGGDESPGGSGEGGSSSANGGSGGAKSGGSGGTKASGGSGGSATGGSSAGGNGGSGTGGSSSGGNGMSGTGGSSTGGNGNGMSGTGGSSTGGSSGTGGGGGMSGTGGGSGTSTPMAMSFKMNCECPVLTGFSPQQFCEAYTEICGYTGANRYADEATCLKTFKGGSSDADGKKAGALCCAYKMPAMKEARCAAAK